MDAGEVEVQGRRSRIARTKWERPIFVLGFNFLYKLFKMQMPRWNEARCASRCSSAYLRRMPRVSHPKRPPWRVKGPNCAGVLLCNFKPWVGSCIILLYGKLIIMAGKDSVIDPFLAIMIMVPSANSMLWFLGKICRKRIWLKSW